MSDAIIKINRENFGSVSIWNTVTHVDTALCRSAESSSEIKCELPHSLVDVKSIKNINLSGNFNDLPEINLSIDTDYIVPGQVLPKGQEKTIHLESNLYLKLSDNKYRRNESKICSCIRTK